MDIKVKLTGEQVKALASGEPIHLAIYPPARTRKESVQEDGLPANILKLVALWNEDKYIRFEASNENRNNPIPQEDIDLNRKFLARCLRELGMVKIKAAMQMYFNACREGRHLWEGRNHGGQERLVDTGSAKDPRAHPGRPPGIDAKAGRHVRLSLHGQEDKGAQESERRIQAVPRGR